MKQIGMGLIILILVKQIILQGVLFGIIWAINTIFNINFSYWSPALVLLGITILIGAAQLLLLNGARKQAKEFEKDFFKDF